MSEQALYRYREAALYLAISESMVKKLVGEGSLLPIHIGRAARIPRSELDWFIKKRMPKRERAPALMTGSAS